MSAATVAVVVPTRDREGLLERCVAALLAQQWPPDEIVIVDDGSRVPAEAVVRGAAIRERTSLRVLRQTPARGPAAARNLGWRAATATFVAFTDDDCRPDAGWLAALMAGARPEALRVGRTRPDPLDGTEQAVNDRTITVERLNGMFLTCNILYPRGLLERLGGFDTTFPLPYGEDSDLGQRALRAGAGAEFVEDALVYHAIHHLSVRQLLRERRRMTELGRLVRRYPELRRQDWAGWFVKREHRVLLEALTGLALLPVTPAGVAVIERYLHECRCRVAHMPAHRRGRDVAGIAALDAYEVAVCLVGSLRHRTVLL